MDTPAKEWRSELKEGLREQILVAKRMIEAMNPESDEELIATVMPNLLKFWALENPASGYLKRYLGNAPFVFDPSEYGDEHSKKTAIWGMFNEPKKTTKIQVKSGDENNYVKSVEKFFHLKAHLIPEGYREKTGLSMRTVVRSITPQGFAQAFYKANQP